MDAAIRHYVHFLRISNIPVIKSAEDIMAMGSNGLVACTCEMWLHYIMCCHSYCTMIKRSIVKGYPKLDCPVDIAPAKAVAAGRPKSTRGGALTKDVLTYEEMDSESSSSSSEDED